MGSELIAHEAKLSIESEAMRESTVSKIQRVGQKMQRENILRLLKLDFNPFSLQGCK